VRKLLLHRRQINKLMGAVEREGMTLVPLKLYFNEKGRAKIELALARGKKLHDNAKPRKKRSWERERGRLLRAKADGPSSFARHTRACLERSARCTTHSDCPLPALTNT
jgi:hypothetical protein